MSLIVMKFGGTSVGNAERIRQAASVVKEHSHRDHKIVVVVSALAKVTDTIVNVLNAAHAGSAQEVEDGLQQLSERHDNVMADLFQDAALESVAAKVKTGLMRLREFCSAVLLLGSATPQVMDMVLPLGERISAWIFTACLNQLGADAEFVDSARVLMTDDKFGDANPDMDSTRQQCSDVLLPLLRANRIPVVMGYSGGTSGQQRSRESGDRGDPGFTGYSYYPSRHPLRGNLRKTLPAFGP
jgi:aspartate kinase